MNNIRSLKLVYQPELYYPKNLEGYFSHPTGNNWYRWHGLCPFHADRRAGSLVINKKTGAYHCFSCGARGGDIIDFHSQINRIGIKEAVEGLWRQVS